MKTAPTDRGEPRGPLLLYADARGNILDHPSLEAVGESAGSWARIPPEDWIPLPEGSELFLLPGRLPVGWNRRSGRFEALTADPRDGAGPVSAVAVFMAPAHTSLFTAAMKPLPGAPLLPLFAYTAAGWHRGRFVAAGFRVDPLPRQDLRGFDFKKIERNARRRMAQEPGNRLVQHLGRCALSYGCPAARNLFLGRWEAPLPTSPVCNAGCLGCISLQEGSGIRPTQERITFVPTPEEIAGVAVPHLTRAPGAVVSFGQGCEGEPLLQHETLRRAVSLIRSQTRRGTINLNTNGSLPAAVSALAEAGLDSIRVSVNSFIPAYYTRYHAPRGYRMEDALRSLALMKEAGRFVSVNYLVFPGVTDDPAECDALSRFLDRVPVDLIQMRNLNIDPRWYLRHIRFKPAGKPLGILNLMARLKSRFPHLVFGYFNPCLDPEAVG